MPLRAQILTTLLFIITCACTSHLANAGSGELYKIVDKDGKITFSDNPPKDGAETIQLKTTNIQQGYNNNASTRLKQKLKLDAQKQSGNKEKHYQIHITAPQEGQQVGPAQKSINIKVSSTPPLLPEHRIQFLLNGQAIGPPSPALNIQIPLSVKMRGKRNVTAVLLDAQDQDIGRSQSVNFYVIRPGGN